MHSFKKYLIMEDLMNAINMNSIIDSVPGDYDKEEISNELKERIARVDEINSNGGYLYRLVFLNRSIDLKSKDIGDNWVADPNKFKLLFDQIKTFALGNKPYIIKAFIAKDQIDIYNTIKAFKENPFGGLIKLVEGPKKIIVRPYDKNKDYSYF